MENNDEIYLRERILVQTISFLYQKSTYNREQVTWEWENQAKAAATNGTMIPPPPVYTAHPEETEVVHVAKLFYDFVKEGKVD